MYRFLAAYTGREGERLSCGADSAYSLNTDYEIRSDNTATKCHTDVTTHEH